MKKLALCLGVCFSLLSALCGAALDFTYSFTAPTLAGQKQYADPGFTRLTAREAKGCVIWRYRDNGKGPVVLRCVFAPGSRPERVEIGYFRPHATRKHTVNYGIKSVKVFGIAPDGRKIPIGSAVLNQPYAKPASDPEHGKIAIALENCPAAAAELHFTGNNGRLALTSLAFSGEKPPVRTAARNTAPSLWQGVIGSAGDALKIRRSGEFFIMENAKVIYAVCPGLGGTVAFAFDRKRKVNLIREAAAAADWGPFFQDRFYPGGTRARDAFLGAVFQPEAPEVTPDAVTLRLKGRGRNGLFTGVLIEKRFILRRSSPVLEVEYALRNLPENVVPLTCGFWCSGGVESPAGYTMLTPGPRRIEETGYFPGYREFSDLSSNWCAVRTPKDDILAFIGPGELMRSACFWTSGPHRGTMECKFGVYSIKAGEALDFSAFLVPFGGMGTPDGVSRYAAGKLAPGKAEFRLFDPEGPGEAEISLCTLKNGVPEWKVAKRESFSRPAEKLICSFDPGRADGFRAVLRRKGTELLRIEKAAPGKSFLLTRAVPLRPESRGAGAGQTLSLNFNSTKVKSPAWQWAVPLAGTSPKILGINRKNGGIRDLVETALRVGIAFDTHYISGRWTLSGAQDLTEERCIKELPKVLAKPYSCILVAGDVWKKFTPAVRTALIGKVKAGTGLILVAPDGLPPELQALCRKLPGARPIPQAAWERGEPSPLTAGFPFELLPPTQVTPCAVQGKVLIRAGKMPLLAETSLGKGKVFVFTWPAAGNAAKLSRSSSFLPRMEHISPLPDWAWHEYQIALFARVICAASGYRSAVGAVDVRRAAPDKLELSFQAEKGGPLTIRCRVRDRFSRLAGETAKTFEARPGRNVVTLDVPPMPPMRGLCAFDLRISSGSGVEWWGGLAEKTPAASRITAVEFPERVYRKSDVIKGRVRHENSGKLRVRAFDSCGNCFGESSGPDFAFALENCTTPSGRITAELLEGETVIDRKSRRFDLFFTPDPKNFNIAFGWPSLSVRAQLFNYCSFMEQMAKFGVTCLNGDRYSLDDPVAEQALRDFGWPQFSTQTHGFLGTKKPYDRNLVPKHKFELVRTPCLSDEKFKARLAEESARLYPNFALGALMVAGPDESNMFAQWDGCFTPACREALRKFLKQEYGSLDALNRSWRCDFKSWDEVTAMTLPEVRNRASFAPWVDHRTFNDRNRADALRILAEGIRKTAPLGYSFSGTQETNPFNAWDWYLMMPYLGGVSSYHGEQTVQHRSFARGPFFQMPWIGYDSPFSRMDQQLWTALMNGATGVNLYGASFYIQPDFTLSPTSAELIRVLDRWRKGPAQALMSAELPGSPVAVHYTPASLKVNEALNLTAVRRSAVSGIKLLLDGKFLSYRYLAYGEIGQGDFRGTKVLFLPISSALSPGETAGLEKFVREGGVLIADMMCGRYDAHGAPAETSRIDALFGLKKPGILQRRSGTLLLGGNALTVRNFESGIEPLPGTQVLGKNPDGSPAVLVNRKGRGMTVYFGAGVLSACGDLQELRYAKASAGAMKALSEVLDRALDHAGVRPPLRIPGLRSASVLERRCGRIRYVGIGRNCTETAVLGEKPERREILLDAPSHVYDLFTRRHLGYGKRFTFEFRPDGQEIFVLLPYRVKGIRCKTAGPGLQVQAEIVPDKGTPGVHTLRFELTDPAGRSRKEYSAWLRTEGGSARWRWIPPLNAMKGTWKLTITDTISGAEAVIPYKIPRL